MTNEKDYVDIGLFCADACQALDRGLNGRQLDELSQSVRGAIGQLTTSVRSAICMLSSPLTNVSIAELWLRFRGISSNRVNEARSLEFSAQGATKMRSLVGSRTS